MKQSNQRRPVLDDTKQREICAILAVGGTRRLAGRYVGCSGEAIRKSAERDKAFRDALDKAESQHELSELQRIQTAAKKEQYWRAAAWLLERTYPDRYLARRRNFLSPAQWIGAMTTFAELIAERMPDKRHRQWVLDAMRSVIEQMKRELQRSQPTKLKVRKKKDRPR